MRIEVNSTRYSSSYWRYYSDSKVGKDPECTEAHAEMAVLRFAKSGDRLEIMRWRKDHTLAMSKPCKFCEIRIKRLGIQVKYTDHDGNWQKG